MVDIPSTARNKDIIRGVVILLLALVSIGLVRGAASSFAFAFAFLLLFYFLYGTLVISLWENKSPFLKFIAVLLMCNLLALLFLPKPLKEKLRRLKESKIIA